jgi:hypothetical protein
MIGCSVKGYKRACSTNVGGADLLLVGDANDFDLTLGAADVDGNATGYSAIARRAGATAAGGAYLFEIESLEDTIGVEITQANAEGFGSTYDYLIGARMVQMSQAMTNFNMKMDQAAVCCHLIFVWRNQDGKIFVAGEKYVGGSRITKFKLRQDGSKIGGGKKFSDFNGQDLSIKGIYSRPAFEFTGGIASIEGFMPA